MLTPFLTKKRRTRKKNNPLAKFGFGCALAVSIGLLFITLGLIFGYMDLVKGLPSLAGLPVLLDPHTGQLFQPTRLYDRTGEHIIFALQNPAADNAQYLSMDASQPAHLPDSLINAILTAFEPDYWESNAYDLGQLNQPEVHPTLEQKFIYQILLFKETPGLRRSLRERLLAAQAVQTYGKRQILEWFINSARYGPGIFGADAAAQVYFNKTAPQLTISESACLAAILENPQANLWDYPQVVLNRQKEIIHQMQERNSISKEEEAAAIQAGIQIQPETPIFNLSPTFSEYVFDQLHQQFPDENFEHGGWKIITSLDFDLQQQAECTLDALLSTPKHNQEDISCRSAQLLPSILAQGSTLSMAADGAVLILDPKTGQILTMVGDVQSTHPAGTLLNPIVYLTAFSRGTNPGSLIWDIPPNQPVSLISDQPESPFHGPVSVRTALVNDYLQPLRTLYSQLGENIILVTANQLGLQMSPGMQTPANDFSFFDRQVSLLDISHAYALFSNQGVLAGQEFSEQATNIEPAGIIRLEDANQSIWLDWSQPATQSVLTPELSYLINHVLSDETTRWPSLGHPNPLEIGRPAGAKIGLTGSGQDNWTIGYTPQVVIGIWLVQAGVTTQELPKTLSAGIWHALMQYYSQGKPIETWNPPAGISFLDVCDPSGLLPTPYCPTVVTEVFLKGSEPTQADYLYQVFQVNRETGRLATVFTPPELIEEKIYLVTPPNAAEWAAHPFIWPNMPAITV